MTESLRVTYGSHISELGNQRTDLVLLEADLADSTQSEPFMFAHPERYFQMGIAEQNMVSVAAGLASEGKLPVVNSFAAFISMRACEQVRTDVAYPNLNVKFVVSHAGVSAGTAGPTHHTLEDIAIMRSIPNLKVFVPGDARELKQVISSVLSSDGPAYVRVSAIDVEGVYTDNTLYQQGKATHLANGEDLTIITTGTMMHQGIQVVEELKKHNLNAQLLQMASIKPLDKDAIIEAANHIPYIFTIEEHSIIGGLGSSVSEVLAENNLNCKLTRFGFNDAFCSIGGNVPFLLQKAGLDYKSIVKRILSVIG